MKDWMKKNGIQEVETKTEGITADHIWYNADILTHKMSGWSFEFQRLVKTMEDRHKEHLKMIADLLEERKQLMARGTKEKEATVIYNEIQEAIGFLSDLLKVEGDRFRFESMDPYTMEGQIDIAIDKLDQLCVRLEAKE